MPTVERLRDFSVAIGTLPTGPSNTPTDVPGVRVGHTTLMRGDDVRTGATAIWPHDGHPMIERLYAGTFALNGYGEMTCRSVIDEWGLLSSPIVLTGTSGVGIALHAIRYLARRYPKEARVEIPLAVAPNVMMAPARPPDLRVTEEDVWAALDNASTAPVEEGCVGAGTGMALFSFKGGIGSSSRVVAIEPDTFTVGVLVETNFGRRPQIAIAGTPVAAPSPT